MDIQDTRNLHDTISMVGTDWIDEDDNHIITSGVAKYSILSNDYYSKTHMNETTKCICIIIK